MKEDESGEEQILLQCNMFAQDFPFVFELLCCRNKLARVKDNSKKSE